jgi:two-component system sensor histidine kinase/response regulator
MIEGEKSEGFSKLYPEIRVVLKSIVNMSNLALKSGNVSGPLVYMKQIRSQVSSLLKKLDRAEEDADVAAIPVELKSVEFSLAAVFEDLKNQIEPCLHNEGPALAFHISLDVPERLFGDPLRLGQILLNLTSNAIKFTREGEVAVSAEVLEQLGENVTIEFKVRDSGPGLSDEQQRALFQSIAEARETVTGLRVVKELVEKMRGTVEVTSELGRGSVFTFTAVFGRELKPVKSTIPPLPFLEGMNVLVVDDNKTMRVMLKLMLESLSFNVTAVSSGAEAIAELERTDSISPYEMVFMDWMMPGMDGLEASKRIIDHKNLSWHPVIFMVSAYGRGDIRLAAEKIGIEGFLEKPVSRSTLQNAVATLFSFKQSGLNESEQPES